MQGIGFAIVGALQRFLHIGAFGEEEFYDEMAFDYGDMQIDLFDRVYGADWYEKHGEGLRKAFVRKAEREARATKQKGSN